jgi:hypothetical protein
MPDALTADQEAQAQQLADRFAQAARDDFLRMARLLVAARSPFGQAEFQLRDLLHRLGARCLEQFLAGKKTATRARA